MDDLIARLKSGKIRIIEINQSEIKYKYVERCIKDISKISKFHFSNKSSSRYNHCYFGCVIAKKPIYLFLDNVRSKIVIYDVKSKKTSYIPESYHESIKKILLNSKSATYYINRNEKIQKVHKIIWRILLIMCSCLLYMYCKNKFDDGKFGTIALNIAVVMALQDCINVYLLRFDRKHCNKYVIFLIILEAVSLISGLFTFFVSGEYCNLSRYINMVSIILIFGTILIKFDKPYANE